MKRRFARVRSYLTQQWEAPTDLSPPLRLEWRFIGIRWVAIVIVAPGLSLVHLSTVGRLEAYGLLGFALAYNLITRYLILHQPRFVETGYFTTIMDCVLNVVMITVAGGFNSPIYYICYTVIIAAAMRYGYGPAIAMAALIVFCDVGEGVATSSIGIAGPFLLRSGFLLITAILAGYLREQARKAEIALQERLRQANLLNEMTAELAASLELTTVLRCAAAAAAQVFGSSQAVLILPSPDADGGQQLTVVSQDDRVGHVGEGELVTLGSTFIANREHDDHLISGTIVPVTLPSGDQAIIIPLVAPTRSFPLAVLVLRAPAQAVRLALDSDILTSFIERITLAVENASLYRTVAQRGGDLQRAYAELAVAHEQLVRVDEMKTDFLANVSHEFRTPLTSIRSFAELLLTYDQTPELQAEFLEIIKNESERLTRMVNDVLDVTRIETENMEWHMSLIDVDDLVRDSARTYVPMLLPDDLVVDINVARDLPNIYGDRDRLQQVIGNLLNNALKFTLRGYITLSAICQDNEIVVSVADTGIGIDPANHQRIFEKFQQVGAVLTDKPRGTGLGLAICKEIVEHHDGRIWVTANLGQGSTFTFTLPLVGVVDSPSEPRSPVLAGARSG